MKLYAAISKVEDNDDGTLSVEGIASTEAVDSDGEVVKASAIEAAIPDFMRYGSGAMREMHQPLAAGTVDKAEVIEGVTYITGTVVDPVAIKKVRSRVYKGFSIGGKATARDELNKKHVTGVKLVEISLVDRPANPDAVLSMWKAETVEEDDGETEIVETEEIDTVEATVTEAAETVAPTNKGEDFEQVWRSGRDQSIHLKKADLVAHHKALDDAAALNEISGAAMGRIDEIETAIGKRDVSTSEREKDAKDGHALPDGSFPIDSVSDLENAVQAYGRAKNKAAAKRHIIRRAKALGATDKLPDNWTGSTKKADDATDIAKSISLYDISCMTQLLASLQWAEASLEDDAYWSGAVNATPELKARFGSFLVEFGNFIADVLDVFLVSMTEEEAEEAINRSEMLIDIVKAGARNSKADMASLQAAHDSLVKMGADCGLMKHEEVEDLTKAETADPLKKALEDRDLFKKAYDGLAAKVDELTPAIKSMAEQNASLEKRLKDIEATPLPAKTAGAGVVISKEQDTVGHASETVISKAEALEMLDKLSPDERALALIKFAHGNPISVTR